MDRAGNVISGCLATLGFFGIGVEFLGVGIGGFSLGFLGFGFIGFLVFLGFSRGFDIGLITTLFGISDLCRAPKIITKITMRNKQ